MTHKYWFSGDDVAIFRVENFSEHDISLNNYYIQTEHSGITYA